MTRVLPISKRRNLPLLVYSLGVGVFGFSLLLALTQEAALAANAGPLLFFAALSALLKRTGVSIVPEINQSLVGIVDLAALMIFGPVLGSWVPVSSSLVYLFLNGLVRGPRDIHNLIESPLYSAGSKSLMGLVCGAVYQGLGGATPPADLTLSLTMPIVATLGSWFLLDNLFWMLWERLYRGLDELVALFRRTSGLMFWVELAPLPFAVVIAVAYQRFGGLQSAVFVFLAFGLLGTAVFVQRFSDQQSDLERRSRELHKLNEFGQEIAQAGLNSERVLDLLVDFAREITKADLYRVELFNLERNNVTLTLEAIDGTVQHPRTESPLAPVHLYLLDHAAIMLVPDLPKQTLPFHFRAEIAGTPATAALFVPLNASGELIGLLTVLSRETTLSPSSQRNLAAMAGEASVVVQNARLFASERRRASQLAVVSEVSLQVARFLDLDKLLQQIVNQIQARFGYANVHVFLVNAQQDGLLFYASTHPDVQSWRAREEKIPFGVGIVGHAASTREPILVADVQQDSRYIVGPDSALVGTRAELAIPLVVGNRVVGVLDVQSEEPGALGEEDLFILKTLGAQIAIAVEDARLYTFQKEETWYLNTLLQVAENLSATTNRDEALETVVRITPLLVGVDRCAILLYDENACVFYAARAYGLNKTQLQRFNALRLSTDADEERALSELLSTRKEVVLHDTGSNQDLSPVLRQVFAARSAMIVPLLSRNLVIGALWVDQGDQPRVFSEHEKQVVMGIANQAAVAIENARLNQQAEITKRLEYEVGLARQIQASLLPETHPTVEGFEFDAAWRVAREVGGDFYDFVELPGDRVGLMIADVSDKGMAAALFMAMARTLMRAMAIGKSGPSEALERANDLIIADGRSDMFVTAFYGVLEPHEARLYFANAGHNPPIWYRRDAEDLTTLQGHGIALGVRSHIHLPERAVTLGPGDVVLLYTDGVTDAINEQEQEFGYDRLAAIVAGHAHLSASRLVDEILRGLTQFTGNATQFDDVTLLAVKREE